MRQKLKEALNLEFSSVEAIEWCTTDHNTTRTGDVPGGLGLKLLGDFIDLNRGSLQIVSGNGYWRREDQVATLRTFPDCFPGTAVNIIINATDPQFYVLSTELQPEDIFGSTSVVEL